MVSAYVLVAVEEGLTVQLLTLAFDESVTLTVCPTVVCVADGVNEICEASLDFWQAASPVNSNTARACLVFS